MKIIIEQAELLGILKFVTEAADKEGCTIPILSHVIMHSGEDVLSFECSNAQQHATALCDTCDLDGTGKLTLPAKRFLNIVKQEKGRITIEKKGRGKKVSIKSDSARYKLDSLSPDEAIPCPKVAGSKTGVAMSGLVAALAKVAPEMSSDETRPALCGVHLHKSSPHYIRVTASDGRRLAEDAVSFKKPCTVTNAIMPAKAVAIICKHVPADADGDMTLRHNKKHMEVVWPNRILVTVLIDQTFPNTEIILAPTRPLGITLTREAFAEALAKVSIMLDSNANCAKFQIVEAKTAEAPEPVVHVLAINPILGEAVVDIVAVELGKNTDAKKAIEYGVNPDYVLDILKVLSEDKVTITWSDGQESGLKITEKTFTGIIMPMRLGSAENGKDKSSGTTSKDT